MPAFWNIAKSTFGELKGALLDVDQEGEDDDDADETPKERRVRADSHRGTHADAQEDCALHTAGPTPQSQDKMTATPYDAFRLSTAEAEPPDDCAPREVVNRQAPLALEPIHGSLLAATRPLPTSLAAEAAQELSTVAAPGTGAHAESNEQRSVGNVSSADKAQTAIETNDVADDVQRDVCTGPADELEKRNGTPGSTKLHSSTPDATSSASVSAADGADSQRLLQSFSERYDSLLSQYESLQRRYQESTEAQARCPDAESQIEVWKSAHHASTSRVEELTLENGDLKERLRANKSRREEPDDRAQLLKKLAQREAEVHAANNALQQMQDVLDDGAGTDSARCIQLESELRATRRATADAELALEAERVQSREAGDIAANAASREAELLARCQSAEREIRENGLALEALLQQKERHLDEKENLIDKRLVTSMLALYQDHLAGGQTVLAQQVLRQTLQILGASTAIAERQRLHAEAAEGKLAAGPLSDAFLDFLTREADASETASSQPSESLAPWPKAPLEPSERPPLPGSSVA